MISSRSDMSGYETEILESIEELFSFSSSIDVSKPIKYAFGSFYISYYSFHENCFFGSFSPSSFS